jgi:osmotically-inducible protein OsmY
MSPRTVTKPRRRPRDAATVTTSRPSTIALYGDPARVDQVQKSLQRLDVTLSKTIERPAPGARTLAVVAVTPLPNKETPERAVKAIRAARHGGTLPLFVVVDDDTDDRRVRQIYAAGATAVFHWPREALLFPGLLAELVGVALVRGRAVGPRNALTRTLTAHLRLVPWSIEGVRAIARSGGEVHLSGSISTYWRKRELVRLLARIPGVTRIESTRLYVQPAPRTDRQIARAVRSTLGGTTTVDDVTVSVSVRDGTVTLAGTVSNRGELARILELVSNVAGVRDLDNSLVVSSKGKRKDGATARRLNQAISRWFADDHVRVTVFAQVAVLSGKVRGLSRRVELERFVDQDPAITRVINKLEVV